MFSCEKFSLESMIAVATGPKNLTLVSAYSSVIINLDSEYILGLSASKPIPIKVIFDLKAEIQSADISAVQFVKQFI